MHLRSGWKRQAVTGREERLGKAPRTGVCEQPGRPRNECFLARPRKEREDFETGRDQRAVDVLSVESEIKRAPPSAVDRSHGFWKDFDWKQTRFPQSKPDRR
jgi:hypothetical protein